ANARSGIRGSQVSEAERLRSGIRDDDRLGTVGRQVDEDDSTNGAVRVEGDTEKPLVAGDVFDSSRSSIVAYGGSLEWTQPLVSPARERLKSMGEVLQQLREDVIRESTGALNGTDSRSGGARDVGGDAFC
ncbi:unnamed protein product, partial [Ilex paraguariensis]